MTKIYLPSWLVIISLSLFSCTGGSDAVDPSTARNLGHLYYMVHPLNVMQNPLGVESYIRENKLLLQEDSPLIRCARILGNKLVLNGPNAFGKTDCDRAHGSVLSMGGNWRHAHAIARSLQDGAVDAFVVGEELLWIADAVPKAANGDWTAFNTTGTQSREAMRQIWPLYQQMGMQPVLDRFIPLFKPMIEEQVKFLTLMLWCSQEDEIGKHRHLSYASVQH